jgi:hypothetical protein
MGARWREKAPLYMRSYLYGITPERYTEMFSEQESRCAICRTDVPSGKGWHLDHDHDTGQARGILCHRCNLGLGNFKDNPATLEAAIAYLRR